MLSLCVAPTAFADDTSSSVTSSPSEFDRYKDLTSNTAPGGASATTSSGDLESANKTKEEIEVEEFNNDFLDTVIYIIGGLCGIMMLLQITAFAVCKLFPSWNHILEKLSKIGITGYEDGWLVPTLKILLLGIFGYLCISGTMKHLIAYILGWYANVFT